MYVLSSSRALFVLSAKVLAEDHSAPVRKEPLVQSPQLGKLERGA